MNDSPGTPRYCSCLDSRSSAWSRSVYWLATGKAGALVSKALNVYNMLYLDAYLSHVACMWPRAGASPDASLGQPSYGSSLSAKHLHCANAIFVVFALLLSSLLSAVGIASQVICGVIHGLIHLCNNASGKQSSQHLLAVLLISLRMQLIIKHATNPPSKSQHWRCVTLQLGPWDSSPRHIT